MLKMPPMQKVYEAYSALGDGRCALDQDPDGDPRLHVRSSDGSKEYTVVRKGETYRSSDPATYWQGYPGYPVIALLLLEGRLPYDPQVAELMAGVPWKKLNDANKRDYDAALQQAFDHLGLTADQRRQAWAQALQDFTALGQLDISVGRYVKR